MADGGKRENAGPCPCGSGNRYPQCCGRFLEAGAWPETAEQLMRSRYTAYFRRDASWLFATWHPSTRPAQIELQKDIKWLGLRILRVEAGVAGTAAGVVEFVARFRQGGWSASRLHESSRFTCEAGRWYYVDGEMIPTS